MNWFFWLKAIRPRMIVKVGDSLTILRAGRRRKIVITGLTDTYVYYKFEDMGLDGVVTHRKLKQMIAGLDTIRTQIEI